MKRSVFALIDCNNFFVSCERLFRPDLSDKPVVVMSSGDGVVISRSNEAKVLGIPMGAPVFKYRQMMEQNKVFMFSGSFELYGNMSRRITELLTTITPKIEVYSVDESFLDLSQLPIRDYTEWGHKVREAILQWTGIPVSIGIATSKTLAKLASDRGKKAPELQGVLSLVGNPDFVRHLSAVPVEDTWGIGWRLTPKIRGEGIANAFDLSLLSPRRAQQLMGVKGRQLVTELNGISCYPLETQHQRPKSISRTRTFGQDTSKAYVVEAALASFATETAFRLRRSGQLAKRAHIFATTNRHKPGYQKWSREVIYQTPTADTGLIISDVIAMFNKIYNPTAAYHRAGVLLYDFVPASRLQTDILGHVDVKKHERTVRRMQVVDSVNERYGKRTVRYAAEDLAASWQPQRQSRSPRYTTNLDELPKAKIYGNK